MIDWLKDNVGWICRIVTTVCAVVTLICLLTKKNGNKQTIKSYQPTPKQDEKHQQYPEKKSKISRIIEKTP